MSAFHPKGFRTQMDWIVRIQIQGLRILNGQSVCDHVIQCLIAYLFFPRKQKIFGLFDTGTGQAFSPGRKPLVFPGGEPGLRDRD